MGFTKHPREHLLLLLLGDKRHESHTANTSGMQEISSRKTRSYEGKKLWQGFFQLEVGPSFKNTCGVLTPPRLAPCPAPRLTSTCSLHTRITEAGAGILPVPQMKTPKPRGLTVCPSSHDEKQGWRGGFCPESRRSALRPRTRNIAPRREMLTGRTGAGGKEGIRNSRHCSRKQRLEMSKISEATGREDKCPDETWGCQEGPRKKDKQEEGVHAAAKRRPRPQMRCFGGCPPQPEGLHLTVRAPVPCPPSTPLNRSFRTGVSHKGVTR